MNDVEPKPDQLWIDTARLGVEFEILTLDYGRDAPQCRAKCRVWLNGMPTNRRTTITIDRSATMETAKYRFVRSLDQ